MAITDLTNTTWYVPSGWKFSSYPDFDIIGSVTTPDNTYEVTKIWSGAIDLFYPNSGTYPKIWSTDSFVLTITGGTDVTNSNLIAWLTQYGELQEEKITDLTGYTVTVPAGWSATAGLARYGISGSVYGESSPSIIASRMYNFCIGYMESAYYEKANYLSFFIKDDDGGDSGRTRLFHNSQSFTFTITGGTDATNTSLIQWLYDNNATFEKTGEEEPDTPEDTTPTATITYDGATVTLKEGQTITFRFAEKVFKSDIVIRNNVSLISFTIDGETYYAIEGMTWAEWVESDYNIYNYFIYDNKVYVDYNAGSISPFNYIEEVVPADIIVDNQAYSKTKFSHSGGSGN